MLNEIKVEVSIKHLKNDDAKQDVYVLLST